LLLPGKNEIKSSLPLKKEINMAIYHSHLFDNASGSVGNVTLCKRGKQNVAKGKIFFKKKKQSPAQIIQQTRFKVLSDLSFRFQEAIRAGFPHLSWSAARAKFIGINQQAVEIGQESLAATILPERITFTQGNLRPPEVNVRIREEERIIRAKRFYQPLCPLAKDDDDVFLIILDTGRQDTHAYPLGKRGTPGTVEIPLDKDFTPADCIAYVFALSPANTRASVSQFTGITLE